MNSDTIDMTSDTKLLNVNELLECAKDSNTPGADNWQIVFEVLATQLGKEIAAHLGVKSGDATFEGVAFAGLCCPFYPAYEGQECPPNLSDHDPLAWGGRRRGDK